MVDGMNMLHRFDLPCNERDIKLIGHSLQKDRQHMAFRFLTTPERIAVLPVTIPPTISTRVKPTLRKKATLMFPDA
jgi:hypothetical protein